MGVVYGSSKMKVDAWVPDSLYLDAGDVSTTAGRMLARRRDGIRGKLYTTSSDVGSTESN